jgi:hypothetical protein
MPVKTVAASAIEQVRRTFQSAPPCQAEQVTMMEAIRSLVPDIHCMQQKGYGLGAIARYFSEQGIDLTEATLRCYLQRAKASSGRRAKRKGKVAPSPADSTAGARTATGPAIARGSGAEKPAAPATMAAAPAKPPAAAPEAKPAAPAKPPAAVPEAPKVVRRPTESPPLRSSFVPREDTEDL